MGKLQLPIKIIVADDHPLCREGFIRMLDKPEFELVGEASDGKELIQLAMNLKPDIIITDIKMPGIDGIEATKQIIKELPNVGIIGMSMIGESPIIIDMIDAGAKGYLLKGAYPNEVRCAVQTVYKGELYYCKEATASLLKMITKGDKESIQEYGSSKFSNKEIDVMKLICHGFSNKEIASNLNLNKRTIEYLREQIMQKLNAKNTAGIVVYAVKNNLC